MVELPVYGIDALEVNVAVPEGEKSRELFSFPIICLIEKSQTRCY
jgi:hypothetical protein